MTSLENSLKKDARWTLMLGLYNSSHIGINERMLSVIFQDMHYSLSINDIRAGLLYLQELGFCRVEKNPDDSFHAVITAKGIDLIEYNVDCPDSIARPKQKYF